MQKQTLPGQYILNVLADNGLNGDAYTSKEDLFQLCKLKYKQLKRVEFEAHLADLVARRRLCYEGRRLYLPATLEYEQVCAYRLAQLLTHNQNEHPQSLPETLQCGQWTLTEGQQSAVEMVCNHKISCILGGAGTGKSTVIRSIAEMFVDDVFQLVLCAPTGKGARNITLQTGLPARTVHSALHVSPNKKFIGDIQWQLTKLLVVDEASMLSLGMLAGILNRVPPQCTVVLVGDPHQLLSVDSGNVLPDLLALGIPSCTLDIHHRQADTTSALAHNVHQFEQCKTLEDLQFDDSFQFFQMSEAKAKSALCQRGAMGYTEQEDLQILSPYNRISNVSVRCLNAVLQKMVNQNPPIPETQFRNGDRVMVTENDWERHVFNGDSGQLWIDRTCSQHTFCGDLGQSAQWLGLPQQHAALSLAYAITVHKAQGSAYDTVLIPLCRQSPMLSRNWLYTAISRGRKRVILYGDMDVLNTALQTPTPKRKSMLVAKTRMMQLKFSA